MHLTAARVVFLCSIVAIDAGCAAAPRATQATRETSEQALPSVVPGTLTAAERAAGWRSLFDGRSLAGWRAYRSAAAPSGWRVVDGTLVREGPGGDIMTIDQFGNFELALEWKVAPGGNSGIFYRVTEAADATYETGPEMQVLDDARHRDGRSPLTSAGALYGLYAAPAGVVKPAGEWNAARIVVNGAHVEHWLNGVKTAEAEIASDDWNQRIANSKFRQWPGFGKATRGHIALQDHGDWVAYRNIKIRELPSGTPAAQLTDVYWRLTEVEGTSVPPAAAGGREAHIRLLGDGGRLTGFTTCNTVFGRYEVPESDRVRFFQLGSTKMACIDAALMRRETQLMAALENADRFAIADETLTLFAQGKPVARFVAVR